MIRANTTAMTTEAGRLHQAFMLQTVLRKPAV